MSNISEDSVWNIIKSGIDTVGLVNHQISSYNNFINHGIEDILQNHPVKVNDKLSYFFKNSYIPKPVITEENRKTHNLLPNDARNRDLTYSSPVLVDICKVETNDEKTIITKLNTRVKLCSIPIMLETSHCHLSKMNKNEKIKNGECEFDKGGYFIIRGKERVLVSQIRSCYNIPFVFDNNSDKYDHICEVRSMSESTGHSVVVKIMLGVDDRSIKIALPYIKEEIPVGIVLKALGIFDKEEIKKIIGFDCPEIEKYVRYIIRDSYCGDNFSEEDEEKNKNINESKIQSALEYIGKRSTHLIKQDNVVNYARQILKVELFPHMGITANNTQKSIFIGYMLKKLLSVKIGFREIDDRDDYSNKRIETPGILCHELFTQLFKKYRESFINYINKKNKNIDILQFMNKNKTITSGLLHCFSTGNWGVPKTSYIRPGVSQVLSRLSYGSTLSHKRRLCIPVGKEAKNKKIRQINPSQIMFICPCETPEGQPVGIVMNFSITTLISNSSSVFLLREKLEKCDEYVDILETDEYSDTKVLINGDLIGYTKDWEKTLQEIKISKLKGSIKYDVSISYCEDEDQINIWSDSGRMIRPVFTLDKDGKLNIKETDKQDWKYLAEKGMIQYIDSSEANNSVIAFDIEELSKYKNDYCEISPAMMLGIMGSIIPWPDHSQSPRNCYQTSMGKQAMSMYALSYKNRTDTISHVLGYPQRPLVSTRIADMTGFNEMPSGNNVIAAIACYTGFNQEDSIIMNESAVDRGLFDATSYRTHVDEEKKYNIYSRDCICQPPLNVRKVDANYSLLGKDGIVLNRLPSGKNVYVNKGDVIIGKCMLNIESDDKKISDDCSVVIKKGEEGWVDRIVKSTTPDGYLMVKIIIRKQRRPEVGDKFASRAAQKGTCGLMYKQYDMPWTQDGITPDIIINPHCIPSRMTINQLMETVTSKNCAIKAKYGDATPFLKSSKDIASEMCQELEMTGMGRTGTEVLYNGFTGEPMGEFFIGPVYYQRLKHLVSEKIHARSTGPITTLTRQPLEGRSRDGGLRFGEMERDAMISHGTSMFLKERLCDQSDPYDINVCNTCGNISSSEEKCNGCNFHNIDKVGIPYVSKLVLQELNAMSIKTEIKIK